MDVFRQLHANGPRALGNVFWCMYVIATEDPLCTMWALWFYERVLFTAFTERPSVDEAEQRLALDAQKDARQ